MRKFSLFFALITLLILKSIKINAMYEQKKLDSKNGSLTSKIFLDKIKRAAKSENIGDCPSCCSVGHDEEEGLICGCPEECRCYSPRDCRCNFVYLKFFKKRLLHLNLDF
jgi:hypothetical protein